MATPFDIAVLVGSLRKDSLNRKTALALMELAPQTIRLEQVEIGEDGAERGHTRRRRSAGDEER